MIKRPQLSRCFQLLALLVIPTSVFAQVPSDVQEKIRRVENFLSPAVVYGDTAAHANLEQRMKETNTKGISIAVINNYKIEWAKGYGWADESEQRKVTTNTRFQAASLSKSLNSMGILKLVEKGKLNPNADINTYLRSWKFPYDSLSKNKKINTYQLLSHTAGLTIHGFPGYKADVAFPTIPDILDGKKPANTKAVRSQFEPGLKYIYSGGGTVISQMMLMDITGRDYAEYMQAEVLAPLKMANSFYRRPSASDKELATGYYADGKPVSTKYHVYPEQAAASLWTTPTDMGKYIIECQLAYEGRSHKVLSPAMMKTRMTPYLDSNFALGVFIINKGDNTYFSHTGGNEAFVCIYYGSLKDGKGLVIMENGENFNLLIEIVNSIVQVYDWKGFYNPVYKKVVTLPKDSLQQYTGKYLMAKDTLSIKIAGDYLVIQQNGEPANGYKILFSDDRSFSVAEIPSAILKLLRNAEGKVDALELKQDGNLLRLPKMPEGEPGSKL
ncbi:MAG: serine hydrolase domain-containing protein [Ferruginibacter sp.]